jgi:glucoamylase
MYYGKPTGAAMPLMWAHAEYIKLLRSTADGEVFDLIPEVADRYLRPRKRVPLEIWKRHREVGAIRPGTTLRVMVTEPFVLHWTDNEWSTVRDTRSTPTSVGVHIVDIETKAGQRSPVRFTFRWADQDRWEGRDYMVEMKPD